MKLIRYTKNGTTYPGRISSDGVIYDLSCYMKDISGIDLSESRLSKIAKVSLRNLSIVQKYDKISSCVGNVGKIVCVGLNYLDHIRETGAKTPKEPVIFSKLCVPTGAYDDIMLPKNSQCTDWEVELAVVIGQKCQHVGEKEALNYVSGYCIMNDLSERHFQLEREGQWVKGKSCEGFAPLGPWLVTKNEIKDVQNLNLYTKVDSHIYQQSNTNQMLFHVDYLVSYLSNFMTLYPGDIVSIGTPPGVGMGIKPLPIYLKPGQDVIVGIEGLGEQKCKITKYKQ